MDPELRLERARLPAAPQSSEIRSRLQPPRNRAHYYAGTSAFTFCSRRTLLTTSRISS
jgi:hypothetical protein